MMLVVLGFGEEESSFQGETSAATLQSSFLVRLAQTGLDAGKIRSLEDLRDADMKSPAAKNLLVQTLHELSV